MAGESAVKEKPLYQETTEAEQGVAKPKRTAKKKPTSAVRMVKKSEMVMAVRLSPANLSYIRDYAGKTKQGLSYLINRCIEKIRDKDALRGTESKIPAKVLHARDILSKYEQDGIGGVRKPSRRKPA